MKNREIRSFLSTVLAVLLAGMLLAAPAGAVSGDVSDSNAEDIIDCVVDNMSLISQVPRPSHHEEKISAFLMDWAKQCGFSPIQDEALNVCFDVPATEGMENYPLMVLQGHMDMVVAVADDKEFDPLEDPITMIRDDVAGTLTADGTSLGADDASGLAVMMAIAEGRMNHGPLRIIVTVDEEDGMEGTFSMSPDWLEGAAYLINIDSEVSDEVLVSTSAGDSVRGTGTVDMREAFGNLALQIEISGLKGGHSGMEIDKGRLNGVIALAGFLKELDDKGIASELAAFSGGTASNAIPSKAVCSIVIDAADREAVQTLAEDYLAGLQQAYAGIEDGILFEVTELDGIPPVVRRETYDSAIRFMTEIIDGVQTMSKDMEGLVESSSNLGIFTLDEEGVSFATYVRSCVAELETDMIDAQLSLADECGYEAKVVKMADAWPYDPDSRLLALTREIYREQNGEEVNVVATHVGLECGTFKQMNPEVDMISIGPDIDDAHTVNETLHLASIPKLWNLIDGILSHLKEA